MTNQRERDYTCLMKESPGNLSQIEILSEQDWKLIRDAIYIFSIFTAFAKEYHTILIQKGDIWEFIKQHNQWLSQLETWITRVGSVFAFWANHRSEGCIRSIAAENAVSVNWILDSFPREWVFRYTGWSLLEGTWIHFLNFIRRFNKEESQRPNVFECWTLITLANTLVYLVFPNLLKCFSEGE